LHQVGDLFELNVKARCQKFKHVGIPDFSAPEPNKAKLLSKTKDGHSVSTKSVHQHSFFVDSCGII